MNGITKWIQNSVEDPVKGGDHKLIIIPISGVFNFSAAPAYSEGGSREIVCTNLFADCLQS